MSDHRDEDKPLEVDEIESEEGELLPDREVMSTIEPPGTLPGHMSMDLPYRPGPIEITPEGE